MSKVGITAVSGGLVTVAVLLASTLSSPDAKAESERTQTVQAQSRAGGNGRSFEQQFWDYLERVQYDNWAPPPGGTDDFMEGQSPHGAFLKLYLNRTAAANPSELPSGSIVIKENYGPDKQQLMAVTVMYRHEGYNPDGGDWYWVKYLPDGTVDQKDTPMGRMQLAGRVKGCIECHSSADHDDFAFLNDGL